MFQFSMFSAESEKYNETKNPLRKPLTEKQEKIIKSQLKFDYELYEFVKKRFYEQYYSIKK